MFLVLERPMSDNRPDSKGNFVLIPLEDFLNLAGLIHQVNLLYQKKTTKNQKE